MGYSNRGSIRDFWPDNTDTELYLGENSLSVIIEQIKNHFGEDVSLDDVDISAEYIHTSCLGYDCYDSSDYTNFIKVTKR